MRRGKPLKQTCLGGEQRPGLNPNNAMNAVGARSGGWYARWRPFSRHFHVGIEQDACHEQTAQPHNFWNRTRSYKHARRLRGGAEHQPVLHWLLPALAASTCAQETKGCSGGAMQSCR